MPALPWALARFYPTKALLVERRMLPQKEILDG